MIADVDDKKANEAVEELRVKGYEAVCVVGDAVNEAFPAKAVEAVLNAFGKVNCLVNNAGKSYPSTNRSMLLSADYSRILLRQRYSQDERRKMGHHNENPQLRPFSDDPRFVRSLDGPSECRYAQDHHKCVFHVRAAWPNGPD